MRLIILLTILSLLSSACVSARGGGQNGNRFSLVPASVAQQAVEEDFVLSNSQADRRAIANVIRTSVEVTRLEKVARAMAEQYHALSQRSVRGRILAVSELDVTVTDERASELGRRLFALFSSELPNTAIRRGISHPAVLLSGNQIGSHGRTRGETGRINVRVVADIRSTESLHYVRYIFVTAEGKVLFSVNNKVDRNWTEVKRMESGAKGESLPNHAAKASLAVVAKQPGWTGCAATRAEAIATYRLMMTIHNLTPGIPQAVKTGSGWCVGEY